MVARDGVERFGVPCFQRFVDSKKDPRDRRDCKESTCVRFVCAFDCSPKVRYLSAIEHAGTNHDLPLIGVASLVPIQA
jgi:hypothetical protein